MNILLIYPEYPDTFWSFKHVLSYISKKAAFPPLGLLTIASMLPRDWNKKLVDTNVEELTDEKIAWSDAVFIGAMIVQGESAHDIIIRCKAKGKLVVAGGPLFTTQYGKFPEVDHFVLNEAEVTLPEFLQDLKEGNPKQVYTSTIRPDITHVPVPQWDLIDMDNYATMAVQYSRGCPFNCEFCDIIIMNGRLPRTKTPEQLIGEVQSLYDAGWRGAIFIVDDNFIANKVRVKHMLSELIIWQEKNKYPFKFLTEASTNLADDEEMMQLMTRANFYKVFLGIETPNKKSLIECNKVQNVKRDLIDTVRIIQSHGMQVMGGFIVGFDNDTDDIFQQQIEFIQKAGIVCAMVGLLNALPQTQLWQRLKSENRLLSDSTGENTDGTINFIPRMDKARLEEGYKRIIKTIYSRKAYYQRVGTFIREYTSTVKSRIKKQDLEAFFKSVWKIGILSRNRLSYWKLVLRTCFTNINALPIAVELAIFGMHYQQIAKRYKS
ncbi:B12-binding domain-containing radical SAM protein [Candidatus Woesearchaeota archaeon]|nr:B12-binding domain-containing radical SAM protein [Candidatus Woesearchaeota archaeon]